MAERKSVHLEKAQRDAISDLVDDGHADRESEALRQLLNAGMREYGFPKGDRTLVPLEDKHKSVIVEMMENDDAVNEVQAHMQLLDSGMDRLGYGKSDASNLSRIATQFAWIFGIIGIAWLAVTITYPVGLRLPAIAAFCSSFGAWGFGQLCEQYGISLPGFVGGEKA